MISSKAEARMESSPRARTELTVGRRYLEHGFLDAAIRLFLRNTGEVEVDDWSRLVDRLMERGRIADAVTICEKSGCPLPREKFLSLGDQLLRRKDLDGAIHFYELADADRGRWSSVVDLLAAVPGRELRTLAVAERHLQDEIDEDDDDTALPGVGTESIALH